MKTLEQAMLNEMIDLKPINFSSIEEAKNFNHKNNELNITKEQQIAAILKLMKEKGFNILATHLYLDDFCYHLQVFVDNCSLINRELYDLESYLASEPLDKMVEKLENKYSGEYIDFDQLILHIENLEN